jgi:hypothetical protein
MRWLEKARFFDDAEPIFFTAQLATNEWHLLSRSVTPQ